MSLMFEMEVSCFATAVTRLDSLMAMLRVSSSWL